MAGVLRTLSQCERVFGHLETLGGGEAPKALGFFAILGDASSRVVAVAKFVLCVCEPLRGGEAVESRSFAEVSRIISEVVLRGRVSLGGREAPKALGFFRILGDASSPVVAITQIHHRSHIAELDGALVQWYGLIHRFLEAVATEAVTITQA